MRGSKKKSLKKLICIGLTLAMTLSMAACGKSDEAGGSGKGDSKNNPNAALAKEGVYSEQPLDIPSLGTNATVKKIIQKDDTIYVVYEIYQWKENSAESQLKLLTMNEDGGNIQEKELQMYPGGVKPERGNSEGSSDAAAGSAVQAKMAVDDNFGVSVGGEADVEDGAAEDKYVYEYCSINYVVVGSDSKLYGMKNYNYYEEDYNNPENNISLNENYICCWELDGIMKWESKLEGLQTEESYSYVQNLIPTENGGVAVLLSGEKMEMLSVAADGTLGERKSLPETVETLNYASEVFIKKDGTINYVYYDNETYDKLWMNTFDFATGAVGEPAKLPDSMYMSGYNGLTDGGAVADIIYATTLGVFALNKGDSEPTQLINFINSDVATNSMSSIFMLEDGRILGFYYDNITNNMMGSIFTKVNPEDIKEKAVLVLAASYISWDLKNRAVEFNKNNENYRIVVKDYSSYNTMDDYMAGYTKLNNDILASGMPDILVVDSNMPLESYIAKGMVADIDKLIAEDEELSGKEFMQNIFDAYRVDGTLYSIIPSFYVRTYIGKTALVGDRSSWTMKEMLELVATLPEGSSIMTEMTRENFMYYMLQFCGNDFIDLSTGKCDFNSENFISMLEFANTLPAEWNDELYGKDYWENYESQYREDRTILMSCFISDVRDMNRNINGYFGENISYIGFPTDSGKGSVVQANNQYVLSAKSENQEGAWEFMRYYLTDEYQKTLEYELAVNKAVFEENARKGMEKPYYIDENTGEKVEYEDTFFINGEEIVLSQMTEEQVKAFVSFVESVDKKVYYNNDVQNIINEEAAAYFEGQKSVSDVAAVIQSRVQIYVNENM